MYFGSTVGRFANRIAGGKFSLDGETHQLAINNAPNHLHGGVRGFDKVMWASEITGENSVRFTYRSPDGEEGYPGNLDVSVEYILAERELTWKATATTDRATPVNITSHGYFNLSGEPAMSVLDHRLMIAAGNYLPVDATKIPTGEMQGVGGTGFDFTKLVRIGENLEKVGGGFDHNFVLGAGVGRRLAARVEEPESGRVMEVFTTEPGLQFYLASIGRNDHCAFCLEPQKFPDSPNQVAFPDSILRLGATYRHEIMFHFPKPK